MIYGYDHVNPVTTILAMCKINYYNQQSTTMMQRWLMAAISFDRCACTSTRAGLRRFATVRVARRVILVIIIIWLVIPIYRLAFYNLKPNACGINNHLLSIIHSIYTAIAGAIFPLLIMIPSLLLNQYNLALKRQRRHQMVVQQKERNATQEMYRKRDQQVLAIMLVQLIVYIITIVPTMIFQIYNAITVNDFNKSINRVNIEQFVTLITDTLASIYPALSFYLNTITSRMFREELMIVLRNLFTWKWLTNTNRVEPIVNNTENKRVTAGYQLKTIPVPKALVPNGKMFECAIKVDPQQTEIK
jgi:uncharacterized membrane protein YbaN (DUF454 family)